VRHRGLRSWTEVESESDLATHDDFLDKVAATWHSQRSRKVTLRRNDLRRRFSKRAASGPATHDDGQSGLLRVDSRTALDMRELVTD